MSVELSVVVPIYNEEENIPELCRRLVATLEGAVRSFELVLVDDGSRDRSWALIAELASRDARVKGLRFSRNFGHQMAFTAGLDHATGEAVVIMDADLQDPPELVPELLARWRDGFEVVYAVRSARAGETAFKRFTAAAFYRLLQRITQVDIPVDTGDFRLMGRRAVAAFRRLPERHRFTRGLVSWLGFPQTGVPYARAARRAGVTKFGLRRMLRFATDAITSFSSLPLQLASWLGAAACGGAAVWLVLALLGGGEGLRAALLPVALVMLAGVQLLAIGLLGTYVGRILDEVKGRPLYLVQETTSNLAGLAEKP